MARYAENTSVSVDKTQHEIRKLLLANSATQIRTDELPDEGRSMVAFRMRDRVIRFVLAMPSLLDFAKTPKGKLRDESGRRKEWEQACRARWRALLLCIKAKLESAASGIEEFDESFLGQIVQPDGRTVAETALPALRLAYSTGRNVPLLPEFSGAAT